MSFQRIVEHQHNAVYFFNQTGTWAWNNMSIVSQPANRQPAVSHLLFQPACPLTASTCTISGTPTVETSNTTYTVTANISNVTYQGSVWLSTSAYATITSAVEGAHLNLGEAMTPITLNYTVNANASSGSTSSTSTFAYVNDKSWRVALYLRNSGQR